MTAESEHAYRFEAFISYRTSVDRDRQVAARLHVELETYRVPRSLQRQGHPARLRPIFRDTEELGAAHDLSDAIRKALEASRFLIVLCSPETPSSSWIDREIDMFCALGRQERVLLVLIAGTPQESFPQRLRGTSGPLAADMRAGGGWGSHKKRRREKLRLLATLIGCSFDELWQRDRRRTLRQRFVRAVSVALGTAALSLFLPPARAVVEPAISGWLNYRISPSRSSDRRATDTPRGTAYGVNAWLFQYGRYPFLTKVLIPEMMALSGGRFVMGDAAGEDDEHPHEVELAPFSIGRFEVTIAQFNAYLRASDQPERSGGPNIPYDTVSWAEADGYCRWVSQVTGRTMRLPTEAEWEYACRAGSQTRYAFGDDTASLPRHAWYLDVSVSGNPRQVGAALPNAFGLFDMHGNVEEWIADWYGAAYYRQSPRVDPKGAPGPAGYPDPFEPATKITRGGSAVSKPVELRCADRVARDPDEKKIEVGFRCAADPWSSARE